jgi:hypothetical protein
MADLLRDLDLTLECKPETEALVVLIDEVIRAR